MAKTIKITDDGLKKLQEELETLKTEVEELENKTAEAGFWDKPQESQVVLKQLKLLPM